MAKIRWFELTDAGSFFYIIPHQTNYSEWLQFINAGWRGPLVSKGWAAAKGTATRI